MGLHWGQSVPGIATPRLLHLITAPVGTQSDELYLTHIILVTFLELGAPENHENVIFESKSLHCG